MEYSRHNFVGLREKKGAQMGPDGREQDSDQLITRSVA